MSGRYDRTARTVVEFMRSSRIPAALAPLTVRIDSELDLELPEHARFRSETRRADEEQVVLPPA